MKDKMAKIKLHVNGEERVVTMKQYATVIRHCDLVEFIEPIKEVKEKKKKVRKKTTTTTTKIKE